MRFILGFAFILYLISIVANSIAFYRDTALIINTAHISIQNHSASFKSFNIEPFAQTSNEPNESTQTSISAGLTSIPFICALRWTCKKMFLITLRTNKNLDVEFAAKLSSKKNFWATRSTTKLTLEPWGVSRSHLRKYFSSTPNITLEYKSSLRKVLEIKARIPPFDFSSGLTDKVSLKSPLYFSLSISKPYLGSTHSISTRISTRRLLLAKNSLELIGAEFLYKGSRNKGLSQNSIVSVAFEKLHFHDHKKTNPEFYFQRLGKGKLSWNSSGGSKLELATGEKLLFKKTGPKTAAEIKLKANRIKRAASSRNAGNLYSFATSLEKSSVIIRTEHSRDADFVVYKASLARRPKHKIHTQKRTKNNLYQLKLFRSSWDISKPAPLAEAKPGSLKKRG